MKINIKIKKLKENAIIPSYAHEGDAGLDLHSCENYIIKPGERQLISTGIAIELPQGYFGSIRGKSGLALKKGIDILGGVIEYTYRGEYGVIALNTSKEDFIVNKEDKIAQLIICPVATAKIELTENLSETSRGENGFGSTN